MEAINIPQLAKSLEQKEVIQVQEFIPELETLTPVRGRIVVKHQGNYLEVSAKAETIITLTCNRCLQQYNYRLSLKTSELIWLDEQASVLDSEPLEREIALEDLVETLSPQGYFQPDVWLYEQLCLAIPPKQLCDNECPGLPLSGSEASVTLSDRRWDALEALKNQFYS